MPTPTYVALAKTVLSSNQSTVTFSGISNAYTDLVIQFSVKTTDNTTVAIRPNNDTSNVYSWTRLYNYDTTVVSDRATSVNVANAFGLSEFAGTANTFASGEMYIPNYLSSANKPIFGWGVFESNNTTAFATRVSNFANLWRNTAAISSIEIIAPGVSFISGSRFDLYGIKNS